jgi:hypothetical protein
VYYVNNTQGYRSRSMGMDFMRNIAGRDWAIGIVAFIAGAWIF